MPEIFNTFWHGGALCPISTACLNSFVHHGHKVNLYSYNPRIAVPRSISVLPAEDILPESRVYEAHGGFESVSNIFRYKLLDKQGGWWADTDVICNTASIPHADIVFAREGRGEKIGSGLMKFPPHHPAMRAAVDHVDAHKETGWGTIGPLLVTKLVKDFDLSSYCWETKDVYPLFWAESAKLIMPEFTDEILRRSKGSIFNHIYTSRFRRRLDFDQSQFLPPRGSYLDLLYLTYGGGAAITNLSSVDQTALRRRIAEHMSEPWIQEYLKVEDVLFQMEEMGQNPIL